MYRADGTATPKGVSALAALENSTAARVAAYRQAQLRKARSTTGGCVMFLAFPSLLFSRVAGAAPGVYWTFFVIFLLGLGAVVVSEWRRTRERIRGNAAVAQHYRFRTAEMWKQVSAMPDDEYARLLRRSQTLDTAGRAARKVGKPAATIGMVAGKVALKAAMGGDLSDALNILHYVDGNN